MLAAFNSEPFLACRVIGDPVAQPRARHGAGGAVRSNSPAVSRFKRQIAFAVSEAMAGHDDRMTGPFLIAFEVIFLRPRSHRTPLGSLRKSAPAHMTSKPDLDNVEKAILDGITQGRRSPWHDDAQVVGVLKFKRWAELGEDPGVRIEIGFVDHRTRWPS